MNQSKHSVFTDSELEASLRGLGVTELEQRLEFAPLLAGSVDGGPQDTAASVCCSCKMPPDFLRDGAPQIAAQEDPNPGGDFWGTGPVNGGGF